MDLGFKILCGQFGQIDIAAVASLDMCPTFLHLYDGEKHILKIGCTKFKK
jgi:hypothetical protein